MRRSTRLPRNKPREKDTQTVFHVLMAQSIEKPKALGIKTNQELTSVLRELSVLVLCTLLSRRAEVALRSNCARLDGNDSNRMSSCSLSRSLDLPKVITIREASQRVQRPRCFLGCMSVKAVCVIVLLAPISYESLAVFEHPIGY